MGELERGDTDEDWQRRLKELRLLMSWSQRRLAQELRVTPAAVSQWESGQRGVPGPVRRLVEIYEQNLGIVEPPRGAVTKLNGSWAARTLKASGAVARIAARLAGSSLQGLLVSNARAIELKAATQTALASELTETLGELKGAMMKVGQTMGFAELGVPEPVREAMRSLQDDAPPMTPATVEHVFHEAFGAAPRKVFARWDDCPIAAASIGQVHRATTHDGAEVAVKVQYPGIREALQIDLSNAAGMDRLASLFFRHQDHRELLEELRDRLHEECDYRAEARSQESFRRMFAGRPGVVIPRVFAELSTDRVLTMEFIDGQRFEQFAKSATQEQRDRAGLTILQVALGSVFRHRCLNADPHPGNYLFLPTGEVAFLDFGCVKHFPPQMVRVWARFVRAVVEGRRADADVLVVKAGFVVDREHYDFDHHYEMMRHIFEPFIATQGFRFNRHFVRRSFNLMVVENPNRLRMRLPRDWLFANRLWAGLQAVLAALEAQADWRTTFDELTVPAAGEE